MFGDKMLSFFFLVAAIVQYSNAINCKGCTPLDSFSFDKIVSKFEAVLVKFDTAYPYGEKHDEFAKVSEALFALPNVLIAEVGAKDYGDRDNMDLIERYGIKKDDFPVVKLFVQGKEKPYGFKGAFNANNLKKFITAKAGIYVNLPGCIKEFDKFARDFMIAKEEPIRQQILKEALDALSELTAEADRLSGEFYVKMMRKVMEKGDDFIDKEQKRISNLKSSSAKKEKLEEFMQRLNILQSFKKHDEL